MSELDYQRGLRGGSCNVSVSDYQRWSDWQAGHQEYERQQNAIDDERYMESLTLKERIDFLDRRIKDRGIEEKSDQVYRDQARKKEKENAYKSAGSESFGNFVYAFIITSLVIIAGYILKWFLGFFKVNIPVIVIWIIGVILLAVALDDYVKANKKEKDELYRKYGKRD